MTFTKWYKLIMFILSYTHHPSWFCYTRLVRSGQMHFCDFVELGYYTVNENIIVSSKYCHIIFLNYFFAVNISPALPPRPESLDATYTESSKRMSKTSKLSPPSSPAYTTSSPPPPPNHVTTHWFCCLLIFAVYKLYVKTTFTYKRIY